MTDYRDIDFSTSYEVYSDNRILFKAPETVNKKVIFETSLDDLEYLECDGENEQNDQNDLINQVKQSQTNTFVKPSDIKIIDTLINEFLDFKDKILVLDPDSTYTILELLVEFARVKNYDIVELGEAIKKSQWFVDYLTTDGLKSKTINFYYDAQNETNNFNKKINDNSSLYNWFD